MTESLVLVPFGDRFLGLTAEEFKTALERGRVLDGTTATPSGANGDAPEHLLHGRGNGGAHRGRGKLVSRTGAPGTGPAPPAREVCSVQVR